MKKKILILPLLLSLMVSIVPLNLSYAQTGRGCVGKYSCYGCKKSNCQVYKVQKITTYYTIADCKKVVARANATSNASTVASIFVGAKSNTLGALIGLYGGSVSRTAEIFKTAIAKGKGLEVSYEYVITKVNASSFARKSSYRFR